MKVVFLGTPDFAITTLKGLLDGNMDVCSIITTIDKPAGRGKAITPSPVKKFAIKQNLPILQPKSWNDPSFISKLKELGADAFIVVAYGKILPKEALSIPSLGCINVHASLLPRHRGAAPIARSILAGDSETGVSIMRLDEGLDTGPVYAKSAIKIENDDTTETLSRKLSVLGAKLLMEILPKIESGEIIPMIQDHSLATIAPRIKKEEGHIDWNKSAYEISKMIRAFIPWPYATTMFRGTSMRVLKATPSTFNGECGTIISIDDGMLIACGNNSALKVECLQVAGRKVMDFNSFRNGYKPRIGEKLA